MRRHLLVPLLLAIAVFVPAVGWVGARLLDTVQVGEHSAPGLAPMTVAVADERADLLVPALLGVVYEAFALTDEDSIYDTLALVASGEALESLYLQRAGALADSGLDAAQQTVHELRVVSLDGERDGDLLRLDAAWQVIGVVGHAEHQHVRGNRYRARLHIAPVDGAFRIAHFELTDVERTGAGTLVESPHDS